MLSDEEKEKLRLCAEIHILHNRYNFEYSSKSVEHYLSLLVLVIAILTLSATLIGSSILNITMLTSFYASIIVIVILLLAIRRITSPLAKELEKMEEYKKSFDNVFKIYNQDCISFIDMLKQKGLCEDDLSYVRAYYPLITGKRPDF